MADEDHMADQCTAQAKSTGERCKQPAVPGASVCRFHGGNAEQVQQKAQERLDRMADETTAEMQDIIQDLIDLYNHAPPEDKTDIARELRQNWQTILDRTGHGPSETTALKDDSEGDGFGTTIVLDSEYVDDE